MADHFFEPRIGEFVGMLWTVDGNRGDGARVNELLDAGAHGGIEKVFCAAHVRIINVPRTLGPQAVIGGDVEDPLGALHRTRD